MSELKNETETTTRLNLAQLARETRAMGEGAFSVRQRTFDDAHLSQPRARGRETRRPKRRGRGGGKREGHAKQRHDRPSLRISHRALIIRRHLSEHNPT